MILHAKFDLFAWYQSIRMLILGPPLRLGLLGEQGSSPAQPAINAQPNRVMLVQLCMVSVHQNDIQLELALSGP